MELEQIIKEVPKVLLHDHLDGGLRPQTVVELAADAGYKKLPTTDAGELALWFHQGANKGNLVEFLKGFEHTCEILKNKDVFLCNLEILSTIS